MAEITARRLGTDDVTLAARMFVMMAEVFGEASQPVGQAYVAKLLAKPSFWAVAGFEDGDLVGGLTAHTLEMTRSEGSEVFLYDIAVRTDRQRRGIGRTLVARLRDAAKSEGIDVVFVPADEDDAHALDFYRSMGGEEAHVAIFTFSGPPPRSR